MLINMAISGDRARVHDAMLEIVNIAQSYGVTLTKSELVLHGDVVTEQDKAIRSAAAKAGQVRVR